MKTLIAYASKYGSTEKCAKSLSQKIQGEVDLCNLKATKKVELAQYNKVIIGGSIYAGKVRKEVREFCSENLNTLKDKKIGLFICGMSNEDTAKMQLNGAFPKELLDSAAAKECFGGEYIFKKMNFIEKFMVKKVGKVDKDMSNILNENIDRLAQSMNNA